MKDKFQLSLFVYIIFISISIAQIQTKYFENGQIKSSGYVIDNEINVGLWKYYREDGTLDAEITFNEIGVVSKTILYYRNGKTQSISHYGAEGLHDKEGVNFEYYENGQLASVGNYFENKSIGIHKMYYPNGSLKSILTFSKPDIIESYISYFPNGQIEKKYSCNAKGEARGEVIRYYEDGKIFIIENFDDFGNRTGIYKSFYPNGKVRQEGEYAGIDYFKKKGSWKTYYENGKIKSYLLYDDVGNELKSTFYNEDSSESKEPNW